MMQKEFKDSLSLEEVLARLRSLFEAKEVDPVAVQDVLSMYKSKEADWSKYAKFDPHRYTRNLVDAGNDKYNIMILCWGEGMASSIHDHPNSHCFVKVLDGTIRETRYEWPKGELDNEPMDVIGSTDADRNDICYIHDKMGLHRMENPSHTDSAVTLHVYVPPYHSCRSFDQNTSHTKVVHMTFWSKYGVRTTELDEKLSGPVAGPDPAEARTHDLGHGSGVVETAGGLERLTM